ncbi:AAA family ATPase [Flavobacterium sp. UBA7682]|uniref:AAA family ATPase n=1 Tax=Flavobacterium sp. UBA7682 TaxID=1946560 RepID=UPI0025C7210F|nr:AAA family ATPase [Flavobacterium sp. UBA7682]
MSKIRIRNFGPIKAGLQVNEGWLDIKRVTVFIGNQGSGKSTVAKLISTIVWIEKALVRGDFTSLTREEFKIHCSYQNIGSYFKDTTEIEYHGKAFIIRYNTKSEDVFIERNPMNGYSFPKIMYVPAERNLVGSVRNVRNLKGLPSTLYTFADEYFDALDEIDALDGMVDLPINNAQLEYEKFSNIVRIKGKDYTVNLTEASSGFQSFVPLYMVSSYLADSLFRKRDHSTKHTSLDEERNLFLQVQEIMSDPTLSEDVKRAQLQLLSAQRSYSAFLNIVEEPEQNLFPTSQREVLNTLVRFSNQNDNNKLIITTHSPYLLNYLTLAVKAHTLVNRINNNDDEMLRKVHQIVPIISVLNGEDLVVYEMEEAEGTISLLEDYQGMPSDDNKLNERLGETNELFARLLEIQQKL